ncbi:MAG: FprA family A-type flavoprotein [Ruthenibacterium lactatiformans]
MGALQAKENIWYVGVQDPGLRVFDIIMHSDHGTSYNSYIVKGTEKTVLFETSKEPFFEEFLANIREVCDPASLDYIVVNHTEPDHTGSMKRLLELAPGATVLGSGTALTFLKEIVNGPFPSRAVTEKDEIDLGGLTMKFLSVPMLHWPDSMYTYIPELKALFTCDSFGCHYADPRVFNDLIDGDFTPAYKYYFDHIIGPFKDPFMRSALDKIGSLPVEFVGNGHGPVLRSGVQKYFDMYRTWCRPEQRPEKVVAVAYVSAYGYTRRLAEHIRDGLKEGGVRVEMYDLVSDDTAAAKAAVAAADGFAGQPHAGRRRAASSVRNVSWPEPHHPQGQAGGCVRQLRLERRGGSQSDCAHAAASAEPAAGGHACPVLPHTGGPGCSRTVRPGFCQSRAR